MKTSILLALFLAPLSARPAPAPERLVAERARGEVLIHRSGKSLRVTGEMGLRKGDRVLTGANSSVRIRRLPEMPGKAMTLSSFSVLSVGASFLPFLEYGIAASRDLTVRIPVGEVSPAAGQSVFLMAVMRGEEEFRKVLGGTLVPAPSGSSLRAWLKAGKGHFQVAVASGTATLKVKKQGIALSTGDTLTLLGESPDYLPRRINPQEIRVLIESLGIEP